jgi:hypothetical protein
VASQTLVPPRTRDRCCYTSALDLNATFCAVCGKPLLRCMAFEECGGLVDDVGLCTVCVAPHVQLNPGTMISAPVGGEIVLPFELVNGATVGRPLFVTGLWSREGRDDWRQERLDWERLEAGDRAAASVTASKIERAGTHKIDIMVTVSSRWRWRQEGWAFATYVLLTVEDDGDKSSGPVVQISGENIGHGNLINISGQVGGDEREDRRTTEAIDLPMQRLDIAERDLGLRGMDGNLRVPRNTPIFFRGFAKGDRPADGKPILTSSGQLAFGRAETTGEGAGDVHLVATSASGAIDENLSLLMSRRHFELYIENDRLIARVTGSNGIRVNGTALGRDKCVILKDGDRIAPIAKKPDALGIDVNFSCELNRVSAITLTRHPKLDGGA